MVEWERVLRVENPCCPLDFIVVIVFAAANLFGVIVVVVQYEREINNFRVHLPSGRCMCAIQGVLTVYCTYTVRTQLLVSPTTSRFQLSEPACGFDRFFFFFPVHPTLVYSFIS